MGQFTAIERVIAAACVESGLSAAIAEVISSGFRATTNSRAEHGRPLVIVVLLRLRRLCGSYAVANC